MSLISTQECLFDFDVTQSSSFASQTAEMVETFDVKIELINQNYISCPGKWNAFLLRLRHIIASAVFPRQNITKFLPKIF